MEDYSSYDLIDIRHKLSQIIDVFMSAATAQTGRREDRLDAATRAEHAMMSYLSMIAETQTTVEIERLRRDIADLRQELRGHRPWD